MTAGAFLDVVGFTAVSNGTGDFVVSAAVTGYQTPASAGAVNAVVYSYRAQSADLTQWEDGFGAYTVAGTTLARTTVVASSTGAKVSFTNPPNVFVTALTADLANASLLTSGTVNAARLPPVPTTQTFITGTAATYTAPAGVRWLRIRVKGGGGGGGGGGGTATGGTGGTGGNSSIFNGLSVAGGQAGTGGGQAGNLLNGANGGAGGTTAVGYFNMAGAPGGNSVPGIGAFAGLGGAGGGHGGGISGNLAVGGTGAANSGGGGGGGSSAGGQGAGGGGGEGAYADILITSPASTYTYTVAAAAAGGAAGTVGTNMAAGGPGATGYIVVEEYYL